MSKPWYKRSWLAITALVFLPPVGIGLTWLTEWKQKPKLILSGVGLFWWLVLAGISNTDPDPVSTAQQPQDSQTVIDEAPAEAPADELTVEPKPTPAQGAENSSLYTVGRVSDGDTLEASRNGETIKVRLACIDAPESDQLPYGSTSTDRLESLVTGQVRLNIVDTDRYGRSVAEVYTPDNTYVNQMLLESGDAVVYPQYLSGCGNNADRLLSAESLAKSAGRGVWSDTSFVMPWDYRQGVRAAAPESPPDTVAASPAPAPTSNLPACVNGDCDCGDFSSWQQAQDVLNAYPGDPHRLDRDNDGDACESLR